jgi:threonine dehydrogenase-like Zn-dependent dehydrogenase
LKAVVFKGPGAVSVEERPEPNVEQPTDAIVRVTMATICGTDLRVYNGRLPAVPETAIGHEFSGVIVEAGEAVERLRVGQRVVCPFSVFCGGCFFCRKGLLTACERMQVFGFGQLGGAQSEYVRVPWADAILEPLPDGVSDEQAAFLSDVLPGTFAALQLSGLQAGETVAVLGCGPTGLCTQLLARHMGAARVIAVDHHPERIAVAEKLGSLALDFDKEDVTARVRSLTSGRGTDLTAEATGTAAAISQAVAMTRSWGTVLNLGLGIERSPDDFPLGALVRRHVRLVPASIPPVKHYIAPLIRMIEKGAIDPSPIVSHVLPLVEASAGYDLVARRAEGALKVLLKP